MPDRDTLLKDDVDTLSKNELEDLLIREGGLEGLPSCYRTGMTVWLANTKLDLVHFKENLLEVYSNNSLRLIKTNEKHGFSSQLYNC